MLRLEPFFCVLVIENYVKFFLKLSNPKVYQY